MTPRRQGRLPRTMILMPALVPFIAFAVGCDIPDGPPQAQPEEWAAICVDPLDPKNPDDDVRLPDDACGEPDDDGDSGHGSFFFLWSNTSHTASAVPAVGAPTKGYPTHRHYPVGSYTINKLPANGAPTVKGGAEQAVKANPDIRRGGFGVSGKSGGTGTGKGSGSGGS